MASVADILRERREKLNRVGRNPMALLRAAGNIPATVRDYAVKTPLRQMGRDAANVGGMVVDALKEDPVGFLADSVLAPWSAARDTGDVRDIAAQYRNAGMTDDADKFEQLAVVSALGGIPVLGLGAKKAVNLAVRNAKKNLPKLATRVEPKLPAQIVPEAATAPDLDALRVILQNPDTNPAARAATNYTRRAFGHDYNPLAVKPPSSLEKQSGIARTFRAAAEDAPGYKHAVFERYGNANPKMVEQSGAQNYDQLAEAAYRKLAQETRSQFDAMPVTTTMHTGDGGYATPSAMLRDVLAKGKLDTYRGGDPHPFLDGVDPSTGLTSNEMFRAVHDYFGHVPQGSTFRADGEEAAYGSHSQMMSPLAQLALAGETRGQNSFVNFSPLNSKLVGPMEDAKATLEAIKQAKRTLIEKPSWHYEHSKARRLLDEAGDPELVKARLRELGGQWQYAPQTPVLLPPEHVAVDTAGGIPDYLRDIIAPRDGTTVSARGVHMSRDPNLTETDPAFFGTGLRGAEYPDVALGQQGAPKRTYFYTGEEGTVNPEPELFRRGDRAPYEAQLSGLYDPIADPEGLAGLAQAYRRDGIAANHLDRMAKEYGYRGIIGGESPEWGVGQRPAMVFGRTPVRRLAVKRGHKGYAEGGSVK